MLVYGGNTINVPDELFGDLYGYDPVRNLWRSLKPLSEQDPRFGHTAVWTGTEMIIWGGASGDTLSNGARYNPIQNSWTPVSTTGSPINRYYHSAVWANDKMILWGGTNLDSGTLNSGGIYDPSKDTWSSTSMVDAPGPRHAFTQIWTGKEMVIWGGYRSTDINQGFWDNGGNYNPVPNRWQAISQTNAPSPRARHSAVWTGEQMIVWGGVGESSRGVGALNDGAIYDPKRNTWAPMATQFAPSARSLHTAVWTGEKMIVWGGYSANGLPMKSGAIYNLKLDQWTPLSLDASPAPRINHTAIWDGQRMLVWGGISEVGSVGGGEGRPSQRQHELKSGGVLAFVPQIFRPLEPSNVPSNP